MGAHYAYGYRFPLGKDTKRDDIEYISNIMNNKRINRILLVRAASNVITKTAHPRHCSPPFILKYMQSLLEQKGRYDTKLIDCLANPISLKEFYFGSLEWKPQLIVIMISLITYKDILNYVRLLKEKLRCLVVGVGQATLPNLGIDRETETLFDFLLPGEAELEFMVLLDRLQNGEKIESIKEYYCNQWRKNVLYLISDLDALPFPKYKKSESNSYRFIYPLKMFKMVVWGHILSSRGCPNDCIFCSQITRETYGKEMRYRNASNVVDEIELLLKAGVNVIAFDDDNFTTSEEHVRAVCREIKSRRLNVKWIAHARVDEVVPSLLKLMKEAGCILLRFGIESGSQRIIESLKKADSHLIWAQRCKNVFRDFKKINLASDALFMIGNPTETMKEIKESIRLAKGIDPDLIQVHYFTPYSDSAAYREYKPQIKSIDQSKIYHYNRFPMINISRISNEELIKARRLFYKRFIFRPNFILSHFLKYTPFYIRNPKIFISLFKVVRILFE